MSNIEVETMNHSVHETEIQTPRDVVSFGESVLVATTVSWPLEVLASVEELVLKLRVDLRVLLPVLFP